ncbi:MAG: hypothetical protein PHN26_09985 [Eubacteriaceae bacterium]|jgi:hypothetical protein|nr:hypothetical protein [Eubacteriaceae bacterium]
MPKNKFQGFIFGFIMSYAMAIGMEVFNVAIRMGVTLSPGGFSNMTNAVFPAALAETAYMGLFVLLFSNLWGNRLGAALAEKQVTIGKDNPTVCRLMRQACTVGVMCPTMSLVATILFNILLGGRAWVELPAIWAGTVIKNFPMAFFWNMYAAAPATHFLFKLIFERHPQTGAEAQGLSD